MKLIDDWKKAHRFAVMWIQGMGGSAMAAWMLLDDAQRAALLEFFGVPADRLVAVAALIAFVAGMWARMVRQPRLHE